MRTFVNPALEDWPGLIQRPHIEPRLIESDVLHILKNVKRSGDGALRELTQKYDGSEVQNLIVQQVEIEHAIASLNESLRSAIRVAFSNIMKFHEEQVRNVLRVETMPGVTCWRKSVPIQKVGIYIPGGTAPLLSTVLMLGIPARLAGCPEIVLCTPPNRDGSIHPAILYAASLSGITRICKVGGAQAIAAMAYGTQSIPRVDKIFGPGNQYVTKAKQLVNQEGTAIDMPAGPSEVLVIADKSANASFVAADLLSQAEHGTDSQVVLVAFDTDTIEAVKKEINKQIQRLPRADTAQKALENSFALCFSDKQMAIRFINEYAAEHVIIQTNNADSMADDIVNAGSIFIGPYSPEAAGDYASGTNHTLPTNGFAKAYSGVSLDSFMKMITYQKLTAAGLKIIGPTIEIMAKAEQLEGHKNAVAIRLKTLG